MAYRILIIAPDHPELSPGGAEIASYLLFRGLEQADGVEPYFLARTGDRARQRWGTPFSTYRGRAREILFFTNETYNFLFSQRSSALIARFRFFLQHVNPHVIHFHHYLNIGLELIAVARAVNPKVRILVTLHEYMAICQNDGQMVKTGNLELCREANPHDCARCFKDIAPAEFFLREQFIKSHFEKVDLFIAPSQFLRQRYIAWGIPDWQIVVLENGTPSVQPPPPRPLAAEEGRSVFGFFGQITRYKGLIELLLAFDHLSELSPQRTEGIRLIIHGANLEQNPSDHVEAVKNLLARNSQRVHFAGGYHRRDLHRLMGAVDWVVVPSIWWENAPLVIGEALAHRRPLICSNIGGMAEKVRSGKDGFHFAVRNPFELAGLILRLAEDGSIWDSLQKTMRRPTTIEDAVSRHLQLYRDDSFSLAP